MKKNNKIYRKEKFEEHYYPVSKDLLINRLNELGYSDIQVLGFPSYFPMKNSDETEDYVNDSSNLELWTVNSALLYDPALSEFISAPYGTAIVRTASDRFETDAPGKEVFIEKKPRSTE